MWSKFYFSGPPSRKRSEPPRSKWLPWAPTCARMLLLQPQFSKIAPHQIAI